MTERIAITDINKREKAAPFVMLTAYTAPEARIIDPHVDVILVGDSLGMVIYGAQDTLSVTMDMMINHGRAVVRSSKKALVVIDMPYGSYETSKEQALYSAQRIMDETGAQAVKLEGGRERVEMIRAIVGVGIPVIGHIGLMPQRVKELGGYRYQGRTTADAERIMDDAQAVQQAGAFAVVIEATKESVAKDITEKLDIPTIGIGASPSCDGQVLVIDDILGLTPRVPSFVKIFTRCDELIEQGVKSYANEVRKRTFPDMKHCFTGKKKT